MPGNHRRGRPYVAVVGGGIAGLTAAWELSRRAGDDIHVGVFEGAPRIGGKLRVSEVAGVPVDEGAESMLARRPEGVQLVHELGAAADLVEPATTSASIWADAALRPMPGGHVMGIPADPDAFAASGLFSADALVRVRAEAAASAPPLLDDVAVGRYVASRLGREIVDRLVEPLLGGVYAGRADVLSLHATLPQLAPALREDGSLLAAARRAVAGAATAEGAAFTSLRGGMGRLPALLAERSGAEVRTSAMVRALSARRGGWQLTVGATSNPEQVCADAVVLAVPARPAARLLAGVAPTAAGDLAEIEYASVALVTFAFDSSAFPGDTMTGSGFLVPPSAGRATKAMTNVSAKWPHLRSESTVVVRCSVGRHGDERGLHVSDDALARRVAGDLADAVGVTAPPREFRVTRWGGALPQYAVGHLDTVGRILSAVDGLGTLAVCGAVYEGVGVPACIAGGRKAADRVLAALSHRREWDRGS